jgi:hypothetical protein
MPHVGEIRWYLFFVVGLFHLALLGGLHCSMKQRSLLFKVGHYSIMWVTLTVLNHRVFQALASSGPQFLHLSSVGVGCE